MKALDSQAVIRQHYSWWRLDWYLKRVKLMMILEVEWWASNSSWNQDTRLWYVKVRPSSSKKHNYINISKPILLFVVDDDPKNFIFGFDLSILAYLNLAYFCYLAAISKWAIILFFLLFIFLKNLFKETTNVLYLQNPSTRLQGILIFVQFVE